MPHVTEHTPKVSTRSVNPSARESSREKRQQDRQTDKQTNRRIVQNHFSRRFEGCTYQSRSYLEVDFLHDANTSIDMEVKYNKTNHDSRLYFCMLKHLVDGTQSTWFVKGGGGGGSLPIHVKSQWGMGGVRKKHVVLFGFFFLNRGEIRHIGGEVFTSASFLGPRRPLSSFAIAFSFPVRG